MSSSSPKDQVQDLPSLTTTRATREDLPEALHLVADSVAQQRQFAARSIILNPLSISIWIVFVAALYQYCDSFASFILTATGSTMSLLITVRWACRGYIEEAEKIGERWLVSEQDEEAAKASKTSENVLLVTKWGEEMVGVLIMRLVAGATTKKQKKEAQAVIRAWTVKLRYRHKGLGRDLLDEASRIASEKFGEDVAMSFAPEHANSFNLLPGIYSGPFKHREKLATKMLAEVVGERPS
ncbi:MAG: SMK killer toxin resistance protein [Chaenotheca gracillima]|nr:MAG: SMK killer toxin resistance protein [Chaenotheca gracillima]